MVKIIDLHFLGHPQTVAAFLLDIGGGEAALVETGPHSTLPALLQGLRENGFAPEDVRHVFLTHVHLDHAGAAWFFAQKGAAVCVHPLGAPHLENPEKLLASARQIYRGEMDRLWGEVQPIPKENLRVVRDGEKVKAGKLRLRALHTPGHAVHHAAWQLDGLAFTGDVGGVRIGGGIVVPPCPPPDIQVEHWLASLRLLRGKRFEALYLTHFGRVDDVRSHLAELQARLLNWAGWIRHHREQGAQAEALTPLFRAYVEKQLAAGGIAGEDLEKYESANPAWMSLAGLMRYWRKVEEAGSR